MKTSNIKIKFYIAISVFAAHFAIISFLSAAKKKLSPKEPSGNLTIKTYYLQKPPALQKKGTPRQTAAFPSQKILKNLEESLKQLNIETENRTTPKTLSTLKKITLNIETNKTVPQKYEYRELLIDELKSHLNLPEFGEVILKLTINPEGTLTNIITLDTKSEKNEKYLKKTLPQLIFPWFNQYLPEKKPYDFTITFKNEM